MPTPAVRRSASAAVGSVVVVGWAIIASAGPAAAHSVEGGELPAPTWLLAYGGAFLMLIVGALLVATWARPRQVLGSDLLVGHGGPSTSAVDPKLHPGNAVGTLLFIAVVAAAIVGPDSAAANVAPIAVLVGWWICLPIACLLLGDVMSWVNPFQLPVALIERSIARASERSATAAGGAEPPAWTSAAFLGFFAWFFLAYHRPGSPRALAVMLVVYAAAAVAGGVVWGRRWLARGEGFGAVSAAVAQLSWRRSQRHVVPGVAALMIVWSGATAFDAVTSTSFWSDVLGSSRGWTATLLNTIGFVWITAIVAGAYLAVLRLAGRRGDDGTASRSIAEALGPALVPIALAWFLTHDLTLLLWDGQNLLILLSDPIARGWDLFGTIHRDFDGRLVEQTWVRWVQVGMLAAGHVLAVVLAHDIALRVQRRRAAGPTTWAMAGLAAVSIATAVLLVLGT